MATNLLRISNPIYHQHNLYRTSHQIPTSPLLHCKHLNLQVILLHNHHHNHYHNHLCDLYIQKSLGNLLPLPQKHEAIKVCKISLVVEYPHKFLTKLVYTTCC